MAHKKRSAIQIAKELQAQAEARDKDQATSDAASDAAEQPTKPKRSGAPFPVKHRASLPRFQQTTIEEARLLAASEPPTYKGQLVLPLDDDEIVDSCPAWLLQVYRRARSIERSRGPMPVSFAVLLGALVTMGIDERTGHEVNTKHKLNQVIGWIHPTTWPNRARDWPTLHRAFEELPSYRIPVGKYMVWLVLGEGLPAVYQENASVWLRKRVPVSAAYGIRINWPTLLGYRPSSLLTRAYLSVHALMDRSAHRGFALTRLIYEPELNAHGEPRRRKTGQIIHSDRLVPNPVASRVGFLPARDVAKFLGMENTKGNRLNARQALGQLHRDEVIEVVEEHRGYRFYGLLPKNVVRSS